MNKNPQVYRKQRSGALHLTQKVDYALMLLICLAKDAKKESVSIKQIAEERTLSFSFLQKIAGTLCKANIIEAERGKYGGYKLKKAPAKITILEIIEALEGPVSIVPCLKDCLDGPPCDKKNLNCEVKHGLKKINKDIESFFAKKTLKEIIS